MIFFYLGSEDGPPVQGFGSDWNEAVLPKEKALEIFRAGKSHEWLCDIAEKIAYAGVAMVHFYLVEGPGGMATVSVDDCDPRCPTPDARALVGPSKGMA